MKDDIPDYRSNIEADNTLSEKREYLTGQLITCIGNKRSLLDFIGGGVRKVQKS